MKLFKIVLEYTISIVIELANYSFYFIVFLSCLHLFITMEKDVVHYGVAILPIEDISTKERILATLLKSIRGVFLSPIKISITLSTVSWVILCFFGVRYLYVYSFLVTVITFLPVFSPSILGIPAALYLYFGGGYDGLWSIT